MLKKEYMIKIEYSHILVIGKCTLMTHTQSPLLKAKSISEIPWINKVDHISQGNIAVVPWQGEEINGENLVELVK